MGLRIAGSYLAVEDEARYCKRAAYVVDYAKVFFLVHPYEFKAASFLKYLEQIQTDFFRFHVY